MNDEPQDDQTREYFEALFALHTQLSKEEINGFIHQGTLTLHPIEISALGDVTARSLLHLQCRYGLDTLSWARLGARVTGVDFTAESIQQAKYLCNQTKLDATFICRDIYYAPEVLKEQTYDIVYTGYGALFWLKDLKEWGRLIAHFLKPGGTFLLVDNHPFANMLDETVDESSSANPSIYYPYEEEHLQYQHESPPANRMLLEYRGAKIWGYRICDVLNALSEAGLHIEHVDEFKYMFFKRFEQMEKDTQGRWSWTDRRFQVPLLFSIKATK